MKKHTFTIIPRSMKSKYDWGDEVRVSGIYECSVCGNYEAFKKNERFSQCQDCINNRSTAENKWYVTNELIYFMSKNINIEFEKIADISVRIADTITEYSGTLSFLSIHILWFAAWIFANIGWFGPQWVFDPFPFGLLTMIVSLEAIFLATIIMMSQNVSNKKAEMRAEHEYQINLETEKNVAEILTLVKEVRKENALKHEDIEEIKEAVESIEEIKEAVEDIQELHEEAQQLSESEQQETVGEPEHQEASEEEEHHDTAEEQKQQEKIKEQERQETLEEFEQHEREQFEKQEELLDEAGIDIIPESAPPVILEEEKVITREARKKIRRTKTQQDHKDREQKRTKRKAEKIRNPLSKKYRKEIVKTTTKLLEPKGEK